VNGGGEVRLAGYPAIGDHAIIGDCRSAALVSCDGSIDWCCLPHFDSPSIFGALLDAGRGGRFSVRPGGDYDSTRRYVPGTNVLETTFTTSTGSCVLRDVMPVASEEAKRALLRPDRELLRELVGLSGEVRIEVVYEPRPGYGQPGPVLRPRGAFGLWGEAPPAILTLHTDVPLDVAADGRSAHGAMVIGAGERRYMSFTYSEEAPAVVSLLGASAQGRVAESIAWWQVWASRCEYDGSYREQVTRSALALKLLTFAPSGAVVAAPTTSLPEHMGGVRNWDYRYCWLRDAAFTVRALFAIGYDEEAVAFIGWMLHATRLTWPELQVLYSVYGEAQLPERDLPDLEGYRGSRPVRIGNDAHGQFQLDVYGEVIDAVAQYARRGGTVDSYTARVLINFGRTVCKKWREPDDGIWEGRGGRFQHTHSKVMCWVALDRLLELHEAGAIRVPVERFRVERDAIRSAIETHGYNEALGSYTHVFDGAEPDASLLLLPLYGYTAADDPRMRGTCERIDQLLSRDGLVYRYHQLTDDGLPPGEGAFGICSFWAVECLALQGELAAATARFERLLAHANDVGLYGEEIDVSTGAALGNFPQAFTHVGLINAALTLAACAAGGTPAAPRQLTPRLAQGGVPQSGAQ
jgi:GH15 family glucan-1,4-alpha-glucosidase